MRVAVIGGGAAGFFSAIEVKKNYPQATVIIFEKTGKLLSKVKVSGGGRCNVTNANPSQKAFAEAYPRGEKALKNLFKVFGAKETMQWFSSHGVPLKVESDGRVFPVSDNSQCVIDCFLRLARDRGIQIQLNTAVSSLSQSGEKWKISTNQNTEYDFEKVIVTTGGSQKRAGLAWLEALGHEIIDPIPSLFTFNMPDEKITELMGVTVPMAAVYVEGTKLKYAGPLLITHWGMSGPVVLKLSAYGARELSNMHYNLLLHVNWVNEKNHDRITDTLHRHIGENELSKLANARPFDIPNRLWAFLLGKCEISPDKKWGDMGKIGVNKLTYILTNDLYKVRGKTTFKEEFVTCGGVSLASIDMNTMESRVNKNLFFAGEVMDIDGITGGYNFQAAWTTAYFAAKLDSK